MTYEEILREVRALPENLKRQLIDELESDWLHADATIYAEADARWDELFEQSQDVLSELASQARRERQNGSLTDLMDEDFA